MPATVEREAFLHCLESVQPGLSTREIIEQSSCLIFQNGKVATFNDELACSMPSGLDDSFVGAVKADKLLEQLRKWSENEIGLEITESELVVSGKSRKAGYRIEKEISLPVGSVEMPKKWQKLPDDFGEAIGLVQHCASQDQSNIVRTCVHIHPEHIEARDNMQLCRWTMTTGFSEPVLIRQASIKHVAALGMTKFGETAGWIHFKNSKGLVLSARRLLEAYEDLGKVLLSKGKKISLPGGLAEAAEKAAIASSENPDHNLVHIRLAADKLIIKGSGVRHWFREVKKVTWTGDEMNFLISPTILAELVKQHKDCEMCEGLLKVQREKFVYISALFEPPSKNGEKQ